jgi:hypothetical protein
MHKILENYRNSSYWFFLCFFGGFYVPAIIKLAIFSVTSTGKCAEAAFFCRDVTGLLATENQS